MTAYEVPQAPEGEKLATLARRFERFGRLECKGYSPLYERLCYGIAQDRDVLAIAASARPGQPAPNLILGAVHSLLLRGVDHRLSRFYPTVSGEAPTAGDAYPVFRDFCLANSDLIRALISTHLVQTNEVGRSACLMPAFLYVSGLAGGGPLALVEAGASGGLNLLFDRFHYDYGAGGEAGDPHSPVRLHCRLQGDGVPPLAGMPEVAYRAGVDLNPIDVRDEGATLWLQALIWPEHVDRLANLRAAIGLARSDPPKLIAGNAAEVISDVLAEVPSNLPVCVFHSFVLHQFTPDDRTRFFQALLDVAAERPLYLVSMQGRADGGLQADLDLQVSEDGAWNRTLLGVSHPHGHWLEWLV